MDSTWPDVSKLDGLKEYLLVLLKGRNVDAVDAFLSATSVCSAFRAIM